MQYLFEVTISNGYNSFSLNITSKIVDILNFNNFKTDLKWNLKLITGIVIGTISINAIWYLGAAVDVLGGHM